MDFHFHFHYRRLIITDDWLLLIATPLINWDSCRCRLTDDVDTAFVYATPHWIIGSTLFAAAALLLYFANAATIDDAVARRFTPLVTLRRYIIRLILPCFIYHWCRRHAGCHAAVNITPTLRFFWNIFGIFSSFHFIIIIEYYFLFPSSFIIFIFI